MAQALPDGAGGEVGGWPRVAVEFHLEPPGIDRGADALDIVLAAFFPQDDDSVEVAFGGIVGQREHRVLSDRKRGYTRFFAHDDDIGARGFGLHGDESRLRRQRRAALGEREPGERKRQQEKFFHGGHHQ